MATAIMAPPILVTPSVHYAVFSHVSPKASITATMPFAEFLLKEWREKKNEYTELAASIVASSIGGNLQLESLEAAVDDALSHVHEGANMAWVVYPKVMLKLTNGTKIEIWGRTDIPTKRFTEGYHKGALAKNWTSVNMRCEGADGLEQRTTQLDKLPDTLKMYETIAYALSWNEYLRMLGNKDKPPCYQDVTLRGGVLITTIAVRDERLNEGFELLRDGEYTETELRKRLAYNPKVQELFLTCFRAAGLDERVTMASALKENLFWKTQSTVGIERREMNGGVISLTDSLEPALYIVTREGKKIRAVGVGFDRSLEADLAAKASAQMERSLQQRF